jgi:hypothetical protein
LRFIFGHILRNAQLFDLSRMRAKCPKVLTFAHCHNAIWPNERR